MIGEQHSQPSTGIRAAPGTNSDPNVTTKVTHMRPAQLRPQHRTHSQRRSFSASLARHTSSRECFQHCHGRGRVRGEGRGSGAGSVWELLIRILQKTYDHALQIREILNVPGPDQHCTLGCIVKILSIFICHVSMKLLVPGMSRAKVYHWKKSNSKAHPAPSETLTAARR